MFATVAVVFTACDSGAERGLTACRATIQRCGLTVWRLLRRPASRRHLLAVHCNLLSSVAELTLWNSASCFALPKAIFYSDLTNCF